MKKKCKKWSNLIHLEFDGSKFLTETEISTFWEPIDSPVYTDFFCVHKNRSFFKYIVNYKKKQFNYFIYIVLLLNRVLRI